MSVNPYVSIAFTNRNDNYGGDLENRINLFIDYYAHYAAKWPGLFEFVICDYNPPAGKTSLREAFNWDKLGDVKHVVVPNDVHKATSGPGARPILDYTGRNVAIRLGTGEFTLVLNQDIFISKSILEFIATRKLDARYFYRADRCDFKLDNCQGLPAEEFEAMAFKETFFLYRRHITHYTRNVEKDTGISVDVTPEELFTKGTYARVDERLDAKNHIVFCDGAAERYAGFKMASEAARKVVSEGRSFHEQFFLHTNAGGDFILAPRTAFAAIHGMPETSHFYMHLDSYVLVQLFAAGYRQALFIQPHRVYHADHDRSGRLDFIEPMTYADHEEEFSKMLRGERSYQFNDDDWGLAAHNLPQWKAA